MDLFDRLRAWWREIAGGEAGPDPNSTREQGAADTDSSARETDSDEYECGICGTGLDDPGEPCPLCNSTDAVPVGTGTDPGERSDSSESTSDEIPAPDPVRTHVSNSDAEDPARKLKALRETGALLEKHRDRWERVDEGFRVEVPGGSRVVYSRVELAVLLSEHHESRPEDSD